jgi:hypothetical protein
MRRIFRAVVPVFLLVLADRPALSLPPSLEQGLPPMRVFTARDFESYYQVWESAAAPDGRMFFGSFGSVLEYNGSD